MPARSRNALVIAAIATAVVLLPTAAASSAPNRDSLSGTGTSSLAKVTINAFNKGKSPTDPAQGRFEAVSDALNLKGPVTCLHVTGRNAGLIYRVEPGSRPEALVGRDVFVTIVDNGKSGDRMGFLPPGTTPPGGGCSPAIMWNQEIVEVTEGDFVVNDAK